MSGCCFINSESTAVAGGGGGSGTVTSVSVVSANGLAGSVANATTTPAITLTTTVTGILSGNGTAISAASTTGSGAVVLATSPTLVTPALGVATATSINGLTISTTTGTLTLVNGSTLATAGANSITLTSTGPTTVTLPTTGTLATLAGSQSLSNKTITSSTYNGLTVTSTTGTFTLTNGKTLAVSNSLTMTGTDGSSVAFGTGGTVAYTSNNLSVFAATTSAQLAGVISDGTGSGALMFATAPVITTEITIPNTGLHILDTNASHDLIIKPGSNITADRTLTLTTGDTDMIVDFTAVTDEFVLAYDTSTNTWRGVTATASGVSSITGTANQVLANGTSGSGQTGAVTLTTPQNIDTTATPQFARLGLGAAANAVNIATITQPVATSGSPSIMVVTGGAHTTLAATVEAIDVNYNLARTVQFATGTIALQRAFNIAAPTYAAVGSSTITKGATLAVAALVAGTNVTITNSYAATFAQKIEITGPAASHIELAGTVGPVLVAATGAATAIQLKGNIGAAAATSDVIVGSTNTRTAGALLEVRNNATSRFAIEYTGGISMTMGAGATGTRSALTITNAAHTTQTTATEIININSTAYTRSWSTGAIATQREVFFGVPTYAFVGASTITTAANLVVGGAPVAGSNATITTAYSMWIQSGVSRFEGKLSFDATLTAAGTTGAQTINKPSGSVNFAAAATTLVVTNNLVTATSLVFVTQNTNDTTATIKDVEISAGSFTIRLAAAATAETIVSFLVIN